MAIAITSWILAIIVAVLIAISLNGLGRTMSWYARPLWLFFLYIIPTLLVPMGTLLLHAKYYHKDIELSPWTIFQLYYDAYQSIWTVILIIGIIIRVRSSFVALIWVFSAALGNLLKSKFFGKWRSMESRLEIIYEEPVTSVGFQAYLILAENVLT